MTTTTNKPDLIAYQVDQAGDNQSYWHRVGAAWKNARGGFQIRLSALPVNGEIVLLPPRESGEAGQEGA